MASVDREARDTCRLNSYPPSGGIGASRSIPNSTVRSILGLERVREISVSSSFARPAYSIRDQIRDQVLSVTWRLDNGNELDVTAPPASRIRQGRDMITSRLVRPLLSLVTLQLKQTRAMHIQSIPMWVGSSNNYAYLVTDESSKDAVIIDPANPSE